MSSTLLRTVEETLLPVYTSYKLLHKGFTLHTVSQFVGMLLVLVLVGTSPSELEG